jgi:peptide/nickel transport system permease protein
MLEVLSQDYVRTARAKGMSERRVVYLHALRNAVIPLLYERALQTDYTTVLGITTFAALLVVAGNLLADVLYATLDPRIRYE